MKGKRIFAVLMVLAIAFFAVSSAIAEGESAGQKFKNFWKRLFNYPAKVVEKSGETVATATKNTAGVVSTSVTETTKTVTGQSDAPEKMITEPVKGAVETVGTAAQETVSIPVEAAKATESAAETQEAPAPTAENK